AIFLSLPDKVDIGCPVWSAWGLLVRCPGGGKARLVHLAIGPFGVASLWLVLAGATGILRRDLHRVRFRWRDNDGVVDLCQATGVAQVPRARFHPTAQDGAAKPVREFTPPAAPVDPKGGAIPRLSEPAPSVPVAHGPAVVCHAKDEMGAVLVLDTWIRIY